MARRSSSMTSCSTAPIALATRRGRLQLDRVALAVAERQRVAPQTGSAGHGQGGRRIDAARQKNDGVHPPPKLARPTRPSQAPRLTCPREVAIRRRDPVRLGVPAPTPGRGVLPDAGRRARRTDPGRRAAARAGCCFRWRATATGSSASTAPRPCWRGRPGDSARAGRPLRQRVLLARGDLGALPAGRGALRAGHRGVPHASSTASRTPRWRRSSGRGGGADPGGWLAFDTFAPLARFLERRGPSGVTRFRHPRTGRLTTYRESHTVEPGPEGADKPILAMRFRYSDVRGRASAACSLCGIGCGRRPKLTGRWSAPG